MKKKLEGGFSSFCNTDFSKEGRHKNQQIILGLLVSLNGYPLAYCIHEGNKYEGQKRTPTTGRKGTKT